MLTHRQFITAGAATFTVVSKVSGTHITFKVEQPKKDSPHFVSVMTGGDNQGGFAFLGSIFADGNFRHGRKSSLSPDDKRAQAFAWLWRNVDAVPVEKMEFLPACACCACGRKLTNPVSVEMAIGPVCGKRMGLTVCTAEE